MRGSAIVVGGGIAGLAVARGLVAAGWTVEVRERASGPPVTGTALGMWPEAMAALDRLGAGERVRDLSVEQHGARLLRPDGSLIAHVPPSRSARLVSRPDLLAALAEGLPPGTVRWGRPVDDPGRLPPADVVVAADGVHSGLRVAHWGAVPRRLGTVAYRGTVPGVAAGVSETWGPGRLFGITPQLGGVTNWFAAVRSADLAGTAEEAAAVVAGMFGDWHPAVRAVVAALDGAPVDRRRLLDLPPLRSYVTGNVVLVGDAAHAMAPNLGRGACESLLDAVALTDALAAAPDVPAALRRYDAARRPAATRVVRLARLANRVSTAGRMTWARDAAVALAAGRRRPAPGKVVRGGGTPP